MVPLKQFWPQLDAISQVRSMGILEACDPSLVLELVLSIEQQSENSKEVDVYRFESKSYLLLAEPVHVAAS